MGTVAVNPEPPSPSSCGVNLESLAHIDITKLSQSELQALSLCSNSVVDLTDDTVSPRIDRAVFNESAGSRRQTFSRVRGGFHQHPRTRLPGLLSAPKLPPVSDPENHSILHYLKHYLNHNSTSNCPPPPPPPQPHTLPLPIVPDPPQQLGIGLQEKMAKAVHAVETKRKRGRKAKGKGKIRLLENGDEAEVLQRINKNGEAVDFALLERNGDDFYSLELEKRTTGLLNEEEVLGFLRALEGQWCSRRKRRKYVDACMFGDILPVDWKLLIGLKRRDGRVSLYCRRIIRLYFLLNFYLCILPVN